MILHLKYIQIERKLRKHQPVHVNSKHTPVISLMSFNLNLDGSNQIAYMWGHLNAWYLYRLLIIFCLFTSYITHKPPTWACYWSLESITIRHSLPGYNHTLGQDHTSSHINAWDKTCISVGRSMKAMGPHSHSSQSCLHIEAEKKMTFILQILFQNHFLKWNVLYFDPNSSINNKAVLIKIMA